MRLVIADTSCFILFKKIDRFDILKNTFREISVTDKVVQEYGPLPDWISVRSDYNKEIYHKINQNFGTGESSCIALAQEAVNPILLIDDRKARKVAEDIGIQCTGSLGVLLIAKRERAITNVSDILVEIKKTDFRMTNAIADKLLELANEQQ
ncbi:DUF3368 domain-containing protein [Neolewinella antarctica]|uniref:DUF3368 domain-containing protein n=1 Tax=Neolewinella antarctica TaxID=442734 RepID=A0ABX0XGR9_9BACT|nr:DUF3368 domain-containing protein [Neolewinella antarctica]NJC28525.1 hypothetical protein [Neolewinella antarctica]